MGGEPGEEQQGGGGERHADAAEQACRHLVRESAGGGGDEHGGERPGGDDRADGAGGEAVGMLEAEGEREDEGHRGDEGGEGAEGGEGEDRAGEEIDRHDRPRLAELAADEEEADEEAARDDGGGNDRGAAVDERFEAGDDEAEGGGAEDGAEHVEIFAALLDFGQMPAEQQRQDREGDGGGEHPRPGAEGEDRAAERGGERGGARHDDAVDAEPAAELALRVDGADERSRDAERRPRAERLRGADDEEEGQRPSEEAEQRGDGEDDLADLVETAVAEAVAERREGEEGHDQHQLVDRDHQHRLGAGDVEVPREGGERNGGDGAVDDHERGAERDGADSPEAAGSGKAFGHGLSRCERLRSSGT